MKTRNINFFYIVTMFIIGTGLRAQCDPGDTVSITIGDTILELSPAMPVDLTHFFVQPTSTSERVIFLLPGMGGNENAWQDVHDETEGITNEYPLYPARKAAVIKFGHKDDPGYTEAAGLAAAGGDIYDEMIMTPYTALGVTDITNNIAIGHSQGGLAGRSVDYLMHQNGKTPQFGGLVTFGSAHQGAEILTNGLPVSMGGRGKLADFGNALCNDLMEGPIYDGLQNSDEPVAKIINLFNLQPTVVDLAGTLCDLITSDTILMAALPGLTPNITTDYMASNEHHTASNFLLNTLNNYTTTIPMVAFYGVEEDPVVWRQLGSLATGVHTYPAFQADPDQHYVNYAADMQVEYYAKYIAYKNAADFHEARKDQLCSWASLTFLGTITGCLHEKQLFFENYDAYKAFKKGHDFLTQANNKWKAIIGARKTITQQNGYVCECQNIRPGGPMTTTVVPQISDCEVGSTSPSEGIVNLCSAYANWETVTTNKESDGVVLAESAKNLPGAVVGSGLIEDDYKLEDTNHQQLRNSSETAKKLNRLFNSDDYSKFFITDTR